MLVFISLIGCPKPDTAANTSEVPAARTEAAARPHETRIDRAVLFGNPEVSSVRISPDGSHLSWRAPLDGVMNLWVAPMDDLEAAKALTKDTHRGIPGYFWAQDSSALLFVNDTDGDENFHVLKAPLDGSEPTDLTPIDGVRVQILKVSEKHPDTIWVGINDRDPALHDVYAVTISTGERELLMENTDGYAGFELDHDGEIRLATMLTPDGGAEIFNREGDAWTSFIKVEMEDMMNFSTIGFDAEGSMLYLQDPRDRDTAAFVALDLESGSPTVLAEDAKADFQYALWHPTEHTPQAAAFNYERVSWTPIDADIEKDLATLSDALDGEVQIASRTLDDTVWVVAETHSDASSEYVLYDRESGEVTDLFVTQPALEGLPLVPMHSRVLKTRDGLDMVSYLTIPAAADPDGDGVPDTAVPMVLLVHGGPWGRDTWGFNSIHQLLANRGYAVLSPNFRGSTGFGKAYVNAANKEWAGKMHDDLIDAVDWAVEQGVAAPDQVAIMGGSYGGYATLVGMTFTPEKFACGVDIVGPSDLNTLLGSIPPYWEPMLDMFATRVGDPRTEEGKALLAERSPLGKTDQIVRPLLIAQGANDPRVKQAEADQIVDAMDSRGIPVTYVLFPDEGHGFRKPENNIAFFGVAEAFLSTCLGGTYEDVDATGSSMQVPNGADLVPSLAAAVKAPAEKPADEQEDAE